MSDPSKVIDQKPASGKAIAKGIGWMAMLRGLSRVMALLKTAILARILLPSDFGLVAIALMILAISLKQSPKSVPTWP